MAFILISLLISLSTVNCDYRQSFTAFHPAQGDYVHEQKHQGLVQGNHPLIRGHDAGSRLQGIQNTPEYTVHGPFDANIKPAFRNGPQDDFDLPQRQLNSFNFNSTFQSTSGSLVEQATALVESAKTLFKSLENDAQTNLIFEVVFETSDCLDNVQDAIELMGESVNLITENAPEIIYLDALADRLENEKNITTIILASAKMIRIFDELLPKLSAKSANLCISSPEESVKAFKKLAHAMIDIKNNRNIQTDEVSRQLLEKSSKIMSEVAKFLDTLNKSLSSEKICEDGKKKADAVYTSIGDIMENLASLFDVLGFEEKSKDIRKQGDFVKKIVDSFSGIDELDATLECGQNDDFDSDYSNLALTLEDLAGIVQSVGIETLSKELGIDLNFVDQF